MNQLLAVGALCCAMFGQTLAGAAKAHHHSSAVHTSTAVHRSAAKGHVATKQRVARTGSSRRETAATRKDSVTSVRYRGKYRGHSSRRASISRASYQRPSAVPSPSRSRQQAPSSDRYREIQQALQQKGYYKGSVDGTWNSESVTALQRFQKDQALKGDGKLDSLSLIALGLGPKHENGGDPTMHQ